MLSSGSKKLLTITLNLGIILQNIWRLVARNVQINISPSNIFTNTPSSERFHQSCQIAYGSYEHQWVNPLILAAAESTWQFWWNLWRESILKKNFDGDMLIRTLPATFLEKNCKIIVNSKVIIKSIIDPDDNLLRSS